MSDRADASVAADCHIFAKIGHAYWETPRCRSMLLPWVTLETRAFPQLMIDGFERLQRDLFRQAMAISRETKLWREPGWLELEPPCERDGFDWPTFAVTKRPFDWAEDPADVPVPPRGLLGDRQQWDFPLRPPAPVVQP